MSRHHAREKALQTLFQLDVNKQKIFETIEHVSEQTNNSFYHQLIIGVSNHVTAIDQLIANNLEHWSIDRIASVEKTILRIAIYEIKYLEDVPKRVAINEAVELAKKFGDDQSGKFVNGVLAKIIEKDVL
ncbi:MAG TPA: transcription antitermination factor NusB [Bacillota bacterium]|nr:transcription antitermination factor NusB [Bacillota bacterium]